MLQVQTILREVQPDTQCIEIDSFLQEDYTLFDTDKEFLRRFQSYLIENYPKAWMDCMTVEAVLRWVKICNKIIRLGMRQLLIDIDVDKNNREGVAGIMNK